MIKHQLVEDKLPHKLRVILLPEINNEIDTIEYYNRNNYVNVNHWKECISTIINQISNPVIAWDNTGNCRHETNGETYANIFGHNIAYTIETDSETMQNYVEIFYFDLKPEDYGLVTSLYETKKVLHINESQLRRIIRESIKKVLNII